MWARHVGDWCDLVVHVELLVYESWTLFWAFNMKAELKIL